MQQPSTGALPHTRTRAVHWISTAAALGAIVGGSVLVQPAGASPTGARTVHEAPAGSDGTRVAAAAAPDPEKADYPFDCAGLPVAVAKRGAADLDGDGRTETVAVVRCDTPAGNPPNGIYVLAPGTGTDGVPRVAAAFLEPKEGLAVGDFSVTGRKVTATLLGYSRDDVPRCCPDLRRELSWEWKDGTFRKYAAPLPGAV